MKGLRLKRQALERDPRSPLVFVQIAESYWHQRRYDDAILWSNKALDIDPRQLLAGEFLAGVYWKNGNIDAFVAENMRRARVFGVPPEGLAIIERSVTEMKSAFARGRHVGLNRHLLDQMRYSEDGAVAIRLVYCPPTSGTSMRHLSVSTGHSSRTTPPSFILPSRQWDGLHEDPRFHQILNRMGLHPVT